MTEEGINQEERKRKIPRKDRWMQPSKMIDSFVEANLLD
jgi:hypothetical protein